MHSEISDDFKLEKCRGIPPTPPPQVSIYKAARKLDYERSNKKSISESLTDQIVLFPFKIHRIKQLSPSSNFLCIFFPPCSVVKLSFFIKIKYLTLKLLLS